MLKLSGIYRECKGKSMISKKEWGFKITWQGFLGFGALMIVFWYMLSELFPERSGDLYEAYWRYGEAAMLGVYVCMVGLKGRVEEKLFAAYAVWMLVSRWLNGDILLRTDFWQVITAFESLLVFAAGLRLEPRQRRRLLNCFAIIYLLFFTALGAAGIFVALTNTCINIPHEYVCIRVGTVSGNALSFFSKTNTVSCMWFFIAWCLAVNMFFSVRHISWRVLLGLDALLLHVAPYPVPWKSQPGGALHWLRYAGHAACSQAYKMRRN